MLLCSSYTCHHIHCSLSSCCELNTRWWWWYVRKYEEGSFSDTLILGIIICNVYYVKNVLLTMKQSAARIPRYFHDTPSIQGHVQFTRLFSSKAWRTSHRLKWWRVISIQRWRVNKEGIWVAVCFPFCYSCTRNMTSATHNVRPQMKITGGLRSGNVVDFYIKTPM